MASPNTYISYKVDTVNFNKDNITSKIYKSNDVSYTILNNSASSMKTEESMDSITSLYRSIIVNPDNGQILCFSPPNSVSFVDFEKKYSKYEPSVIYANEIIEGTMINLFWDPRINSWEIATRGAIGGNYWYYRTNYDDVPPEQSKQTTFREMFFDALRLNSFALNDSPILQSLPKDHCFSFVLQHPDNHIVLPISYPQLYLVSAYHLTSTFDPLTNELTSNMVTAIPPYLLPQLAQFSGGLFNIPHYFTGYENYQMFKNNLCSSMTPYNCLGVMFTNLETGERCSMENIAYEQVKELRGNNPNLQYQYFCLLRTGKKQQFLTFFPRYRQLFGRFNKQYNDFITNVHQAYFSYYVKKEGLQIPKKYFIHASKIHHNVFIPKLQGGEKIIVTRDVVKNYFDELTPNELLYYLNYDRRQINKEIEKNVETSNEMDISYFT